MSLLDDILFIELQKEISTLSAQGTQLEAEIGRLTKDLENALRGKTWFERECESKDAIIATLKEENTRFERIARSAVGAANASSV